MPIFDTYGHEQIVNVPFYHVRPLLDGLVPSTQTTIFTATKHTRIPVGSLVSFNVNAAAQTIVIYVNRTGTARQIDQLVLNQNESGENNHEIVLSPGDSIELDTTTASAVNYMLNGEFIRG